MFKRELVVLEDVTGVDGCLMRRLLRHVGGLLALGLGFTDDFDFVKKVVGWGCFGALLSIGKCFFRFDLIVQQLNNCCCSIADCLSYHLIDLNGLVHCFSCEY